MENCPHCSHALFRMAADGLKIKAATSCLVLHKSGDVEINCPKCKLGVLVPLNISGGQMALKKARPHKKHLLRKG